MPRAMLRPRLFSAISSVAALANEAGKPVIVVMSSQVAAHLLQRLDGNPVRLELVLVASRAGRRGQWPSEPGSV